MPESVSTAGHGPARGYSGMIKNIDAFLRKGEGPGAVERRRRAAFGPQVHQRPKPLLDRSLEASEALLAYLEDARIKIDKIICDVRDGMEIARKIREG